MANLFSAGDTTAVGERLKKLMAVRLHRRQVTVGDVADTTVAEALADTGLTPQTADDIYYLTSLAKFDDRFVIPAAHREQAIEMMEFAGDAKGSTGFGFKTDTAKRGA
jgi:nitrate reductase beta subunit